MKIFIIVEWLEQYGGAEILATTTALMANEIGFDEFVICMTPQIHSDYETLLNRLGIPIIVPTNNAENTNQFIANLVNCYQPAIIHFIPFEETACSWLESVPPYGTATIITEVTNANQNVYWITPRMKKALLNAKHVIAMSTTAKNNLVNWYKFPGPITIMPPCAYSLAHLREYLPQPLQEHFSRNIVCIARLSEEKGIEFLLGAMKQLRDDGLDVKLSIFGEGTDLARLSLQVKMMGLEKGVFLKKNFKFGGIEDVLRRYGLVVLPSLIEGLPTCLLEAMACGRTFVATNVGGIGEIVQNNQWAKLVRPADTYSLYCAIKDFITNPSKLIDGGILARKEYQDNWSYKIRLKQLENLYLAVAKN